VTAPRPVTLPCGHVIEVPSTVPVGGLVWAVVAHQNDCAGEWAEGDAWPGRLGSVGEVERLISGTIRPILLR
jgi:hypothetical protein